MLLFKYLGATTFSLAKNKAEQLAEKSNQHRTDFHDVLFRDTLFQPYNNLFRFCGAPF